MRDRSRDDSFLSSLCVPDRPRAQKEDLTCVLQFLDLLLLRFHRFGLHVDLLCVLCLLLYKLVCGLIHHVNVQSQVSKSTEWYFNIKPHLYQLCIDFCDVCRMRSQFSCKTRAAKAGRWNVHPYNPNYKQTNEPPRTGIQIHEHEVVTVVACTGKASLQLLFRYRQEGVVFRFRQEGVVLGK